MVERRSASSPRKRAEHAEPATGGGEASPRRFLLQRSHNDHELFPDAICVIGAPEAGDGLVMEYFDSRGVRRTYRVSLDDGVWRIWRDHPGFDQRFSATLGHSSFDGVFELAETPDDWQHEMKVTYRRRD